MIRLKRDTYYATGYSAWFVLHIGWWCWFFGSGLKGRGPRLELFTPPTPGGVRHQIAEDLRKEGLK